MAGQPGHAPQHERGNRHGWLRCFRYHHDVDANGLFATDGAKLPATAAKLAKRRLRVDARSTELPAASAIHGLPATQGDGLCTHIAVLQLCALPPPKPPTKLLAAATAAAPTTTTATGAQHANLSSLCPQTN